MRTRSSSTAAVDPVTEVLQDLRLSGSFYCRSELRSPWGLAIPNRGRATVHFVAEGVGFLRGPWAKPVRLEAGDMALVPRGARHSIAHAPEGLTASIESLKKEPIGAGAVALRHGGRGERTLLICAGVRFEDPALHPLLDLMPDVIHVRGAQGEDGQLLPMLLAAMGVEARSPRPGAATVMTRLADVLVIQAVRSWLDSSSEEPSGWLGALRDPQVGRALALMHRRTSEPWTVASLATAVHMSRSAFSDRFTSLVGVSPLQYLTRWRMHLARGWLREERLALGEVASRLGYESEPSFSRAFKRHMGISPGAARRSA